MIRSLIRVRPLLAVLFLLLAVNFLAAQAVRNPNLVPDGKGFGLETENAPEPRGLQGGAVTTGNGILYHGGPVMKASPVPVYFIWYGNWTNGPQPSDSQTTINLLDSLFSSGGIGGSGYENINTTYGDNAGNVSGGLQLTQSTFDNYSHGKRLSDSGVQAVVSNAISSGQLPNDPNGIYFVLTSSDVRETSGFCTRYCGWHTHGSIGGSDIKYSFVGNPDRCPNACEAQTTSPNGDSGADGMASIMAHESEEAASDPDLNAWYDSSGAENADKCAWKFGPLSTAGNGSKYNQTFGSTHWLIQMNWENGRGGGCAQTLGGPFYTN
jgi:Phosphate-induced protein 1 conserved region